MKTVLIVAAHPDDELLGVGGTAALHAEAGDQVYSVVMCEGESLRYQRDVGQKEAMKRAAEILSVKNLDSPGFPDQRLDTFTLTDLISPLEKISEEIHPNIVYCQSGGDINRDHQLLFEAANVAFRPLEPWIEEFLTFYTPSSSEWGCPHSFRPDTWVDISSALEKKIQAFSCYESEVRDYPHPRSCDALRYAAHFFGNQCLMDAAEAFMTVRRIRRSL